MAKVQHGHQVLALAHAALCDLLVCSHVKLLLTRILHWQV
jgi:hypothetical protein